MNIFICLLVAIGVLVLFRKIFAARSPFSLRQLRKGLTARFDEKTRDVYSKELEPLLDQLESKYGDRVPLAELHRLQRFIRTKMTENEARIEDIIAQGAKQGETFEIESLRRSALAAYTGPNPYAYAEYVDRFLYSVEGKYGTRIPVDHAYRILKDLESGRGFPFVEPETPKQED